ncbi:MAG: hypothetical protein AAGI12_02855 [Pseudomonadota bacterium]
MVRNGLSALALAGLAVGVAACSSTMNSRDILGQPETSIAAVETPRSARDGGSAARNSNQQAQVAAAATGLSSSADQPPRPDPARFGGSSRPAAKQRDGCLDIASIRERDIARNRAALTRMDACIKLAKFTEGGLPWQIYTITGPKKRGPLWAVPHDNEDVAFDTGVYALAQYGGVMVATEAGEKRSLRGQDANRNFNKSIAIARKCRLQKAPAPRYTDAYIKPLQSGQPIIALHSNANGYSGNGGSGTISIRRKSSIMRAFASRRAKGALADEDNILLVAARRPVESDRRLRKLVNDFNNKGVHVIAELVTPGKNDCSLSNYVVLNGIAKYYNIEVQDGKGAVQRDLLRKLMAYGPR